MNFRAELPEERILIIIFLYKLIVRIIINYNPVAMKSLGSRLEIKAGNLNLHRNLTLDHLAP